jgi:hypothetical protein
MKKNLGKLLLLFLLNINLYATTYEWSASINKKEAFVNEAIHLKYICSFSDEAKFYDIEFNPAGEYEKYSIKNLRETQNSIDGKKVKIYEFLAYAKVAGEVSFNFEAVMKKTTKDSVEEAIIGRDNMKRGEFSKENLKLAPLSINAKDIPLEIVGNFDIEIKKNEPKIKAYEPYHLEIKIKGEGNFELLQPFGFEIDGVKVFAEEVVKKTTLSEDGESGEWSQKFAFVADKSFKIPAFEIDFFNPKEQKNEKLLFSAIDVEVEKGYAKEELLDKEQESGFKFDISYLYYLAAFVFGYLFAKIEFKKASMQKKVDIFGQKVEEIKSLEALAVLLALEDAKKYEHIITQIEDKKITSLKMAKEAVFK